MWKIIRLVFNINAAHNLNHRPWQKQPSIEPLILSKTLAEIMKSRWITALGKWLMPTLPQWEYVKVSLTYREVCHFIKAKKVKNDPIMNIQTYVSFYHEGQNEGRKQISNELSWVKFYHFIIFLYVFSRVIL